MRKDAMRKLVIRGVYYDDAINTQSFPLTEDGQKEAVAITGKQKPDAYGVYELNWMGFLQWEEDFDTFEQAQVGCQKLNERS